MKYIVHRRYKKEGLCGKEINLPYGTKVIANLDGMLLTKAGDTICHINSECGKMHFAVNEDSKGLERGKYTYAIAFGRKNGVQTKGFRFTDKQRSTIIRHYQRFIVPEHDFIIFNNNFFKASVAELKGMAKELEIKV